METRKCKYSSFTNRVLMTEAVAAFGRRVSTLSLWIPGLQPDRRNRKMELWRIFSAQPKVVKCIIFAEVLGKPHQKYGFSPNKLPNCPFAETNAASLDELLNEQLKNLEEHPYENIRKCRCAILATPRKVTLNKLIFQHLKVSPPEKTPKVITKCVEKSNASCPVPLPTMEELDHPLSMVETMFSEEDDA